MKKAVLLVLITLTSIIGYSQKFEKVYRASVIKYDGSKWNSEKDVYPKNIFVITNGWEIKITNEAESKYITYGDVEKIKYEEFDCYSWDAYDKDGKVCQVIIKDFYKTKIQLMMFMYYSDSIGFEYEIEARQ